MKLTSIVLLMILCASVLLSGCGNRSTKDRKVNQTEDLQAAYQREKELNLKKAEKINREDGSEAEVKQIKASYSEQEEDFVIAGLRQLDSIERVKELLGEPLEQSYTVRGDFRVQDQYLLTNLYYKDIIISIREFFKDGYEQIEGLVEINITGNTYQTARGIRVGDTADKVKETYGLSDIYQIDSDAANVFRTDLFNRMNHLDIYSDDKFFYEYGKEAGVPEAFAYVEYSSGQDNSAQPPILVFLFHDNIVTNIILLNTVHLYV